MVLLQQLVGTEKKFKLLVLAFTLIAFISSRMQV
jgi:hypothetical protein